ncbi:MAG TPA: DUF4834 family protein [Puia sp.]|jgi:hypothetical protein|nr:DUF4834 family protein [Puia sp.]
MNVIFLAILFYLLYRFITGFLIPVFRTTRRMRDQFNQMKGGPMNNQPGSGPAGTTGNSHASSHNAGPKSSRAGRRPNTSRVGEYIDFEEVKE